MNEAKVRLSANEMQLVTNAGWILTKNNVLQKTKRLLEGLLDVQEQTMKLHAAAFPPEILEPRPKLSRGEQYRGLPYLVLDYPRFFDKEHVFAVRTMFWWGHFFSITLHLSGKYKSMFLEKIQAGVEKAEGRSFFIGRNEWEHHFDDDNYLPLSEMTASDRETAIAQGTFLKLAQKIPLEKWDDAQDLLAYYFVEIVEMLEGC